MKRNKGHNNDNYLMINLWTPSDQQTKAQKRRFWNPRQRGREKTETTNAYLSNEFWEVYDIKNKVLIKVKIY